MLWLMIALLACVGAALGAGAIELFGRSLEPMTPSSSDGPPIHAKAIDQPAARFRLTLARYYEAVGQSIRGGEKATDDLEGRGGTLAGFLGLIVAIGAVLVFGIWIGAR